MSTPGPERIPSTVKVDKTSGQGKPPAKSGSRPPAKRPPAKSGGGKGRKPVTPIKVHGGRAWGPIIVAGVVVLIAVGIIGWGVYAVAQNKSETSTPWAERAANISGIVDYRTQKNPKIDARDHKTGPQTYETNPPVGGAHNATWQNCMGDVYDQPIANEHAVHSLEHGAIWVTYKQGLAADQVADLKKKVEGKDYMLMSPIASLDKNISLQAWGYQLKLDSATDPRIDDFIKALRLNATMEPTAICSNGNTTTGPLAAGS
jgi:hypothetical protein